MQIGFAFRTLALVLNIDRRRDDRAAERAAQNLLKIRHLHGARCFASLRASRSTFGFFAWFFSLPLNPFAVAILIAVLAVFSFHNESYKDK